MKKCWEEVTDQDLEGPMEVEMEITEIIGAHLDLVEMEAVTTTITTMKMKRSLVTQINLVTIQTIIALTLLVELVELSVETVY